MNYDCLLPNRYTLPNVNNNNSRRKKESQRKGCVCGYLKSDGLWDKTLIYACILQFFDYITKYDNQF